MILKAENICKTYIRTENNVSGITDINITVNPFEYHCLYGTSGSGKSTLLNILSGMLTPSSGKVYVDNEDFYNKKETERTEIRINEIGYIMQGSSLLGNLTVYENIVFTLEIAGIEIDYQQVEDIIDKLRLSKLVNAYPKELSGGEYRRTVIARTVISNPSIILADEPTSNLDEDNANIIRNIFDELNKQGKGVLVATHDKQFMSDEHVIHYIKEGYLKQH